ncbi:MAG: HAMP domain-containing protein [Chloroflexi bacterium]|nr:HAMP domain-containing protein [Chloroflexota bacterium]
MRLPDWFRSLPTQSALGIILPIVLVTFGVIAGGLFAYQQMVTWLVIDRDRQLATMIAANVTETINGYAGVLEALASNVDLQSPVASLRNNALAGAAATLEIFNAGVMLVDKDGKAVTTEPFVVAGWSDSKMLGQDYFQALRQEQHTLVSSVLIDPHNGENLIIIGAPLRDQDKKFAGALLGGVYLRDAELGAAVKKLTIGDQGFAYLVDRRGHVIFHPEASKIGEDYSNRYFVDRVIAGETGGTLWTGALGERMVEGYAPVPNAGWGLIVVEPWDAVIAPVQTYSTQLTLTGLGAIAMITFLLWYGVRRITNPVRRLAEETNRLAAGDTVHPVALGGILEIDILGRAFNRMAAQIASYRAGLRRYLGAMTKSQEDERRRLARELHDETTQSLLAITRRLELFQAVETDPERLQQLKELQTMLVETLRGVRQISRDLRPLILEDLGLVPALEMLVRTAREPNGAHLDVNLEVSGAPVSLRAEQELSLYRITQEALTNVRKHAHATEVRVNLTFEKSALRLIVADNGEGFKVPGALTELAQRGSFGLMGIQERVWAMEGSLSVESGQGQGTQLLVTMPLENHSVEAMLS